jgi:hypothetical protein
MFGYIKIWIPDLKGYLFDGKHNYVEEATKTKSIKK